MSVPVATRSGNFPPQWTEWNGKYRDTVRDFWRGEPQALGEFASRLTGSADLYEHSGRRPVASVNFVTAHDGFTLRDLVSYNREAQRGQRRGRQRRRADDNRSWNGGVEGPTDDHGGPHDARSPAAQLHRDAACCRRACRCSLHGDELGSHPAGQQQRLRAGQRADLGRLGVGGPAAHRVHRRAGAAAARAPDLPPQPLLQRTAGAARSRCSRFPTSPGVAPTARRCSPRTGTRASGGRSAVFLNGDGIRERDRRGEHDHRPSTSSCCSTPATSRSTSHSGRSSSVRAGTSSSTPPASQAGRRAGRKPGSAITVEAKAMIVLVRARRRSRPTSITPSPRRSRAAVPIDTEDMPAHAPRPEVLK